MSEYLLWFIAAACFVHIALLAFVAARISLQSGESTEKTVRDELRSARDESAKAARELREEVSKETKAASETMVKTLKELTSSNESRIDALRGTIDSRLEILRQSNDKKLDEMRKTVDEKLQGTLDRRLGDSFKLVSDRLEAVQRGLGEMQSLATGVGDLKRVLTNVKARGTWAEIQLGAILEQILTSDQYDRNVRTNEEAEECVEYAIRLPGSDGQCVWLPIDSKFPNEDYTRLLDASEASDADAVKKAAAALARAVQASAQDIRDKYLNPPVTTDFALMFVPTEGLYAEIVRQPDLVEKLQQTYRVVVAGPTNLAAILSSLRMGFRTLAIEQRTSEVRKLLSAVKTEFGKFGDVLDKVKKHLSSASRSIEQTGVRTRAMERKLRDVEELPANEAAGLLELSLHSAADHPDREAASPRNAR